MKQDEFGENDLVAHIVLKKVEEMKEKVRNKKDKVSDRNEVLLLKETEVPDVHKDILENKKDTVLEAEDVSKDVSKEENEDASKDVSKEENEDVSKEESKDVNKEVKEEENEEVNEDIEELLVDDLKWKNIRKDQ
jgi:hypothetical protein